MNINELATRMSSILGLTESVEVGSFSRENISDWDSLKHIDVIFFLQSHTGVQITVEDMECLNDLESIFKWISKNAK